MADHEIVKLDPETERQLVTCMKEDISCGKFQLTRDRVFVLDGNSGDAKRTSLLQQLKQRFPFIDFDTPGVKLLEVEIGGHPAHFSIVPRWDSTPDFAGHKGPSGPGIGLQFTIRF